MAINGAGGTPGGLGRFFLGLAMMIAGGYLFLDSVQVYNFFSLGRSLFLVGHVHVTGGMCLIPLTIGIGMVFYNARNWLGWLLALGSLVAICAGVLASIRFSLSSMSLFDLLIILVLCIGGLGLFLSSLRSSATRA